VYWDCIVVGFIFLAGCQTRECRHRHQFHKHSASGGFGPDRKAASGT
jgi:hypothetical protein